MTTCRWDQHGLIVNEKVLAAIPVKNISGVKQGVIIGAGLAGGWEEGRAARKTVRCEDV